MSLLSLADFQKKALVLATTRANADRDFNALVFDAWVTACIMPKVIGDKPMGTGNCAKLEVLVYTCNFSARDVKAIVNFVTDTSPIMFEDDKRRVSHIKKCVRDGKVIDKFNTLATSWDYETASTVACLAYRPVPVKSIVTLESVLADMKRKGKEDKVEKAEITSEVFEFYQAAILLLETSMESAATKAINDAKAEREEKEAKQAASAAKAKATRAATKAAKEKAAKEVPASNVAKLEDAAKAKAA